MNTATLRLQFATPAEADRAGKALAPDHGKHVQWRVEGNVLVLVADSENTLGLVRTLDDVLGCIRALGVA